MSEFEREERYIVVKRKYLDESSEAALRGVIRGLDLPTEECVVVEPDWPNYEHVWDTVKQVAEGTYNPSPDAYAVIDDKGQIDYTTMVEDDEGYPPGQAEDIAKTFCHNHINEACSSGVPNAGKWVVRALTLHKREGD